MATGSGGLAAGVAFAIFVEESVLEELLVPQIKLFSFKVYKIVHFYTPSSAEVQERRYYVKQLSQFRFTVKFFFKKGKI